MALVPCVLCHQPFYASCHDASCIDAVCPYCEYAEWPATSAPADPASILTVVAETRTGYQTGEIMRLAHQPWDRERACPPGSSAATA